MVTTMTDFPAKREAMVEIAGDGLRRLGYANVEIVEGDGTKGDIAMTRPDGKPVQRSGDTLTVLRKGGDGKWRLFRDANLVS